MKRVLMASLAVLALAFTPALWALDEPPEAKAKQTTRQQFQSVLDEYQRTRLLQKYPNPSKYAERFLAIAEKNPDDPAAIDALVWAVRLAGSDLKNTKLIERLVLKNAANPKIGQVTSALSYTPAPWAEGVMRAVADKSRDRAARGQATLALAQYLKRRIEIVRLLREDPKLAATLDTSLAALGFDKDAIARLKTTDPDALAKEAEGLFGKVVKDYNDVASGRGTLGKTAAGELNEIRNLGIGKPCPEISGDDIDGKPFKLSDYKGKVVVVDFWGDW